MLQGATTIDKKAQEDFSEIINFLELFLSKTTYVACDHLTVADIALMASVSTIEVIGCLIISLENQLGYI